MNTLRQPYGPLKIGPALAAREQSCAGVAQLAEQPTLTRKAVGSLPIARTKHATAAVGVVVMPAHPCGEQQAYACRLSSAVEQRVYAPRVGSSNLSADTNRMRSAASESRQLHAGVMVKQVFHMDYAIGSSPIIGTKLRRRKRMDTLRLCQHGLKDGHSVSTGAYAGSNPAAGAMDQMKNARIQSSRIRLCAGRLNGIKAIGL